MKLEDLNLERDSRGLLTNKGIQQALDLLKEYIIPRYQPAPAPAPTPVTLEMKRNARLFREGLESLSPELRAQFQKEQGLSVTLQRLAARAKAEADAAWEKREQQGQNAEYEKGMWQGTASRDRLPGTDYGKLFELQEQTDQRRKERLEARAKRELASEVWDEELPRVLAGFDREELEIFNRLMDNQPTELEALRTFQKANGVNPIADINDPAQLYQMGLGGEQPAAPELPADVSKVDDINTLYAIALKRAVEGE